MGQIYRIATKVLVWLGCDEDNQAERAVAVVQKIGATYCEHNRMTVDELDQIDMSLALVPELTMGSEFLFPVLHGNIDALWSLVARFLSCYWFSCL